MARPRSENSENSFGGLGLLPEQEKRLRFFLKEDKDDGVPSLKYLLRHLLKVWLQNRENRYRKEQREKQKTNAN